MAAREVGFSGGRVCVGFFESPYLSVNLEQLKQKLLIRICAMEKGFRRTFVVCLFPVRVMSHSRLNKKPLDNLCA